MNFSAINFPWIGRHPYQQAATIWLFVFLLSAPMVVIAILIKHAWWAALMPLAFASLMSLIFLLISLALRKAMHRLERSLPAEKDGAAREEFRTNGFVVKGMFRTPGLIVVQGDRLVLVPLMGKRVDVQLAQIRSVAERRMFNGNLLMGGARGYWLDLCSEAGTFWRLGVAVPNPAPFREVLHRHHVPLD